MIKKHNLQIIITAVILFSITLFVPMAWSSSAYAVEKEWVCDQNGLALPDCKQVNTGAGSYPDMAKNPIYAWINFFINLISAFIIMGAIIMVAVAGLQYMSSRDNAQSVQAAKSRIGSIAAALLFYFFLYAFVQWLIPGGVF